MISLKLSTLMLLSEGLIPKCHVVLISSICIIVSEQKIEARFREDIVQAAYGSSTPGIVVV